MTAMIIREATAGDLPVLSDFQRKMALETEDIKLDESLLLQGLNRLFQNAQRGKYYVADLDGTVVGCLMTTFEWSEWRNGSVLWIQSVYVAKPFRGQGVYRKMYEHIQDMVLQDASLKGIRLYADKKNNEAHKVYGKMGMNGDHYLVYEWMK